MTSLSLSDRCPVCGHQLVTHYVDFGCLDGWRWGDQGLVSEDGCNCPLTLCQGRGGKPFEVHR